MKKENLHANYSRNGQYIQLCFPIDTAMHIPVNDSVRLLDQVFERIDYTALYRSYSPTGRNPAVEPKTLFKLIVYAYSKGLYSSRKIEEACQLNLAFRWLLQDQPIPDHNTIARFRKQHLSACAEDLLTQFIQLLAELGEVQFEHLFVDGTKIEANANKYSFVWRKATEKFAVRLQDKVRKLLAEAEPDLTLPTPIPARLLRQVLERWQAEMDEKGIVFVYGKGKRKTAEQRRYELLTGYTERCETYESHGDIFAGRNSFSKVDHDATFMHLKDDHMRNSQLKPAYNVQVGVESEYIVGIDISPERNDYYTLKPFLNRIEKNYQRKFKNLIADAGYESEENYEYLEEKRITPFIKPSNYEYSKTRKFQRDMEFRLSMTYDANADYYVCKNGRILKPLYEKTIKRKNGYQSAAKIYQCESCEACPYLGSCYKGKYAKRLQVNERFDAYRANSLSNITSEQGVQLRVNRSIQAEGVFGITKQDMGFTRFLTRGTVNVRTEYLLLALGFNINKLHHRLQKERYKQALFKQKDTA